VTQQERKIEEVADFSNHRQLAESVEIGLQRQAAARGSKKVCLDLYFQ
jgi:hypothetical protein